MKINTFFAYAPFVFFLGIIPCFNGIAESQVLFPVAGKLLDMTYPFDEKTIYWPTAEPFRLEKLDWGILQGGWWYASNNYRASEHGGTHADAPIHFA